MQEGFLPPSLKFEGVLSWLITECIFTFSFIANTLKKSLILNSGKM